MIRTFSHGFRVLISALEVTGMARPNRGVSDKGSDRVNFDDETSQDFDSATLNTMEAHLPNLSTLCERCRILFSTVDGLRALKSPLGFRHHKKSDLDFHATSGCELCVELNQQWWIADELFGDDEPVWSIFACREDTSFSNFMGSDDSWKWTDDSETSGHPLHRKKLSDICAVARSNRIWFHLTADECKQIVLSLVLFSLTDYDLCCFLSHQKIIFVANGHSGDPAAEYIGGRPIPTYMRSDFALQRAKEWISECENGHGGCPGAMVPLLPTRVIDVGSEGRPPRLHLSNPGERKRYAALSYCWGGDQPYATKTATLNDKIAALPMSELGQTIQDAISVARSVSIPFVWVDALCIIQDDKRDKRREIANMGDIYRHATVTITAANAIRAADGFLRKLPESGVIRCPLLASKGTQGVVTLLTHKWLLHRQGFGDPIDQRGWCFQEAVLPCRRLIFSKHGLFWDCLQENHKPVAEGNVHLLRSFNMLPPPVWGLQAPYLAPDRSEQATLWKSYVREFAKRLTTDPLDRINAIAGIGQVLQDAHDDEYLMEVGMFRKSMIFQLGWSLHGFTARNRRARDKKTYNVIRLPGIPTWS
jgi:hypothetical protein